MSINMLWTIDIYAGCCGYGVGMSKNDLSLKQKVFCEEYAANGGNGTQAAIKAGYKNPDIISAQNLRKLSIADYIESLTKDAANSRIMTAQERQEFWSSVARGEITTKFVDRDGTIHEIPSAMNERLRASELSGKGQGDFIERKDINVNGTDDGNWKVEFVNATPESK